MKGKRWQMIKRWKAVSQKEVVYSILKPPSVYITKEICHDTCPMSNCSTGAMLLAQSKHFIYKAYHKIANYSVDQFCITMIFSFMLLPSFYTSKVELPS